MKQTHWNIISLLLLTLFFSGCSESGNSGKKGGSREILPDSNGAIDEIMVVADRQLMADSTKDILFDAFSAPYEVLPQYEPRLITRFVEYNKLTELLRRFRVLVFVADMSYGGKTSEFVRKNVPAEILEDNTRNYYIKKNAWASPQLIVFVFADDQKTLWQAINTHGDYLSEIIQEYYEPFLKDILFAKDHNYKLEKKLKEEYHLYIEIPEGYVLAQEEDDFLWIRRETTVSSENIMISFQDHNFEKEVPNIGIQWRNRLGKEYISTHVDSSYMTTDTILNIKAEIKKLKGTDYIESRGLWKVENDFMGGPFLNYLVTDKKNKRLILLDAFIHAPGEKKRIFMRKAKVIFNTLQLN